MKQSFFARRSGTIILGMAFLVPFIWMGTRRGLETNRNDVKNWLPDDFPETKVHGWFEEHFPHEQFVLASWDGCTLDDQRLELLARKLVPPKELLPEDEPWFFKSVLTGQRLVEDMRARYPDLPEEEVFRRLEGSLIGKDHHKTCLVVTLSEEANGKNLRAAIGKIRTLAQESGIEPMPEEPKGNRVVRVFNSLTQSFRDMIFGRTPNENGIRLGGPPVDNVAIDVEGECTLFRLAGLSAIVGLGISWLCFRSIRLTSMVFGIALLAAGIGLASVFFSRGTVDAILLSMPSLVYVLAMSGAVHIINYYHDAVREGGLEGAPEMALRHGAVPCALAALTTALGLGSLVASHLIPISKFGLYAAWGVIATLGLLFLHLPACLHFMPSREYVCGGARNPRGQCETSVFVKFWHGVGEFVARRNLLVTAGCLAAMAFFIFGLYGNARLGLPGIQTSVKLMKFFSPDAQIINDYSWLEEHLGPLVPMEVVIRIDNQKAKIAANGQEQRLSTVDRMRLVDNVERAVEQLDDVGGALSAATFAPDISPDTAQGGVERIFGLNRRRMRDSQLSRILDEHRAEFREYLTIDKAIAVADVASDPTVHQLGIGGETAKLLEANRLPGLLAIEAYGDLTNIDGIDAARAAEIDEAIAAWREAHHDPSLAELGIEGELAEHLRAKKLNTLLAIEKFGDKDSVEENLATIRALDPDQVAQVAQAIDAWRTANGEELWRISARVQALGDLDYGQFVNDIQASVEPVLAAYREAGVEGIDASYTGLVPLVYKAQRELLHGLYNSIKWAFVLIAVVMIFVLRSPTAGLLAMVPNVFPVVMIFGAMAWLGILVDVGTMMTASVALGVAVDDTLHYLTWFRRGLDEGLDRKGAVMLAYERCGTAMTQTTLIGGFGLSVFAFSTFTPTQRFGVLMLAMLGAALIGDLVFLPAMLCGPIGRCFRGSKKKPGSPDESPTQQSLEEPTDDLPIDQDGEVVAVPIDTAARSARSDPSSKGSKRSTRAS